MKKKQLFGLTLGISLFVLSAVLPFGSASSFAESGPLYGAEYENAIASDFVTENITFATKNDTQSAIPFMVPRYSDGTGKTQLCAVVAGASAIGYFDRLKENLMPNFTAYRVISGKTIWKNSGSEIQTLINDLYNSMGTGSGGTTYEGFQAGMDSYISAHGYTFDYLGMGSDHAAARSWLDQEKLVALFMLDRFNLFSEYDVTDKGSYDEYLMRYYNGNHVVLCYGYRTITYYNADGTVKDNHRFYKCYTGIDDMPFGWVDLDRTLTIGGMMGINVL